LKQGINNLRDIDMLDYCIMLNRLSTGLMDTKRHQDINIYKDVNVEGSLKLVPVI